MQSKPGLLPAAEVLSGLDGPVKAIREATPQAVHHFTQADQVNLLVGASEADPNLGFMARMMVLCSLPRTNPGNRKEYKRVTAPSRFICSRVQATNSPTATSPPAPGLALHRSSTDGKTRARPGPFALWIHADARYP